MHTLTLVLSLVALSIALANANTAFAAEKSFEPCLSQIKKELKAKTVQFVDLNTTNIDDMAPQFNELITRAATATKFSKSQLESRKVTELAMAQVFGPVDNPDGAFTQRVGVVWDIAKRQEQLTLTLEAVINKDGQPVARLEQQFALNDKCEREFRLTSFTQFSKAENFVVVHRAIYDFNTVYQVGERKTYIARFAKLIEGLRRYERLENGIGFENGEFEFYADFDAPALTVKLSGCTSDGCAISVMNGKKEFGTGEIRRASAVEGVSISLPNIPMASEAISEKTWADLGLMPGCSRLD